jgi:glutaredoxin-related protein
MKAYVKIIKLNFEKVQISLKLKKLKKFTEHLTLQKSH